MKTDKRKSFQRAACILLAGLFAISMLASVLLMLASYAA